MPCVRRNNARLEESEKMSRDAAHLLFDFGPAFVLTKVFEGALCQQRRHCPSQVGNDAFQDLAKKLGFTSRVRTREMPVPRILPRMPDSIFGSISVYFNKPTNHQAMQHVRTRF